MEKILNFNSDISDKSKENISEKKTSNLQEEQIENKIDEVTTKELEQENQKLKKELELQENIILELKNKNNILQKENQELIKNKNTYLHKINNNDEYYAYYMTNRCNGFSIDLNNKQKINIKNDNTVIKEFLTSNRKSKLIEENINNIQVVHIQSKELADKILQVYDEKYKEIDNIRNKGDNNMSSVQIKANYQVPDSYIDNRRQIILTFDEIE